MASSDDEDELLLDSVTNYHFVDGKGEPISFSVLPILFDDKEKPEAPKEQEVFLHGTGDGGLQKVYKQVTAWKLSLENTQPEVMVLAKGNNWISLLKPRKIYEGYIRTILITMHLLHILRRRPESSGKTLWDHLCRIFSSFEDPPTVNDLIDHYPLIELLVERDDRLAKSELLLIWLKERPRRKTFGEDLQNDQNSKKPFIVDNVLEEDMRNGDGDESEEEPELFDSVCAFCDNGGEILCCEGNCIRSFHATVEDGEDTKCTTLGFSKAQVEAFSNFLCKNCKYKQHQCFVCGKLGSSDKSAGAEVFRCVNATCGRFYHPQCVADLLFRENKLEAEEYAKKIATGEKFTCPVHKCRACGLGENKEVKELQFAVCRRCPKSYHRKCLPRKIAFEDMAERIIQRAWEGLLPNRILIYCLKHKIDDHLGTPIRNHIVFPETPGRKKLVDMQKSKGKVLIMRKSRQISVDLCQERNSRKPVMVTEKLSSSGESQLAVRSGKSITRAVLDLRKQLKPLKVGTEPDVHKSYGSVPVDSKKSLKEKANAKIRISSFPKIDIETEKKMIAFMENTSSSLTLEDIEKKRTVPSTYRHASRNTGKSITLGKVEGSVEAVKAAFQKLEDGGTVEDAKAVCEPDIIRQIMRWNNKLKVYLAPFLHGMRYTSYGRHFTKVNKIEEIADKLQWYVQNGDTIVDFCCGANDFSRKMKEKLGAVGKKCSFKNYDIIQPKDDFSFEKRDWFTVQPDELPTGSRLIMGLNPPFGVNASLANQFINKALGFKPKLLILIVPSETERLDWKRSPYDLIWEDCTKLSGKSFYLPGSVAKNGLQIEQWNLKAPPLYLWSRPDWTTKHRAIALKHGHTLPAEDGSRAQRLEVQQEHFSEIHESTEAFASEERIRAGKRSSPMENENNRSIKKGKALKKEEEAKRKEERDAKKTGQEAANRGPADELSDMSMEEEAKRKEERDAKKAGQEAANRGPADELSDMSISSEDTTHSNRDISARQFPLEAFEITGLPQYQRPGYEYGPNSAVEGVIDDVARGYAMHNWSNDGTYVQPRPYCCQGEAVYASGYNNMFPPSSYGLSSLMMGSINPRHAPGQDEKNVSCGPPLPSGFAQGPQHQFPRSNSGGWLND